MARTLPRTTAQLARWTQRRAAPAPTPPAAEPSPVDAGEIAAAGVAGPSGTLPFLDEIQGAFGHHDVRGVRAHVGGPAAEAADALGAHGYATGGDVAFAAAPDLHLAAHEAAHVVQQRAGVQLASAVGEAGDAYERHADRVADAVVRGESAAGILDEMAGGGGGGGGAAVQRKEDDASGWMERMTDNVSPEVRFEVADERERLKMLRAADRAQRIRLLARLPIDRSQSARTLIDRLELSPGETYAIFEALPHLLGGMPAGKIQELFYQPHGRYESQRKLFRGLPRATQLEVLSNLDPERRARLYPYDTADAHRTLMSAMTDDELTAMLARMEEGLVREILAHAPPHVRDRLRRCAPPVHEAWLQAMPGTAEGDEDRVEARRELEADTPSARQRGRAPRTRADVQRMRPDEILELVTYGDDAAAIAELAGKMTLPQRRLVLTAAAPAQLAAIFVATSDGDVADVWAHAWSASARETIRGALRRLDDDQLARFHLCLDPDQQQGFVDVLPPERRGRFAAPGA